MADHLKEPYVLQSVAHALTVLDLFQRHPGPLTLNEVSKLVGQGRSSAYRILTTLKAAGYLEQEPGTQGYRLGLKLVRLAWSALGQVDLRRIARPHLEALGQLTEETVHLAILHQDSALFIDKVESHRPLSSMGSFVGWAAPMHCTASGKLLLAHAAEAAWQQVLATPLQAYTAHTMVAPDALRSELENIRQVGYAEDREEVTDGLHCLAAPIRDATGEVVGTVSISGPTGRIVPRRADLLTTLQERAAAISRDISAYPGAWPRR